MCNVLIQLYTKIIIFFFFVLNILWIFYRFFFNFYDDDFSSKTFWYKHIQEQIRGIQREIRTPACVKPLHKVTNSHILSIIIWTFKYKLNFRLLYCIIIFFFYFFFYCSNHFHFNLSPLDGGLFLCCGQLVGKKGGPRHINCAGLNSGFKIGGLFLEMEFCPFP